MGIKYVFFWHESYSSEDQDTIYLLDRLIHFLDFKVFASLGGGTLCGDCV